MARTRSCTISRIAEIIDASANLSKDILGPCRLLRTDRTRPHKFSCSKFPTFADAVTVAHSNGFPDAVTNAFTITNAAAGCAKFSSMGFCNSF